MTMMMMMMKMHTRANARLGQPQPDNEMFSFLTRREKKTDIQLFGHACLPSHNQQPMTFCDFDASCVLRLGFVKMRGKKEKVTKTERRKPITTKLILNQ